MLEELNVGFDAFSPLANGFLSDAFQKGERFEKGDYRNFMPQYQAENYDANRELLSLMRRLAAKKNAAPAQIALAWMLNKKPYIVPIPGSRKVSRIRENLEAGSILMTPEEVAAIDAQLDRIPTSEVFGGAKVRR